MVPPFLHVRRHHHHYAYRVHVDLACTEIAKARTPKRTLESTGIRR